MNIYKYEMYFNDQWNDISSYVETNTTLGDRLDKTFNISTFILPHIKADKFAGIDLSVAIKPWIPVKVSIDSDVFRFYTADCSREMIKKTSPSLYKHNVQLVEATRILQRKTIADITVTQPKSKQFTSLYISDYKTLSKETITNTEVSPTLSLISNSLDTSVVNGNVLKAGSSGQVLVSFDIENYQFNRQPSILGFIDPEYIWWEYNYYDGEAELRASIYVNGVLAKEEDFYIPATTAYLDNKWYNIYRPIRINTPAVYTPAMSLDLDESLTDQTITVKLKTLGIWNWKGQTIGTTVFQDLEYPDELKVITRLSIGGGDGESLAFIYLDELANKCIRSLNQRDINDTDITNDYRLDPVVEAKLKGKLSPEFTWTNYKAWDALEKIANTQNAIPEIKDDFRTITFRYLDEIPDMYYDQDMFYDETTAYSSNEYVDGLELNAPNLVEQDVLLNAKVEPYEDGWGTVRSTDESASQLTDDNAVFKTRQLIHKIYKLYISGVAVKITDGVTEKTIYGNVGSPEATTSYWDISDRVVRDEEWNVYDDTTANTDSGRTGLNTKGNHIYYTQGSNLIKGLGHKTLTVSDIIGSSVAPRALLETIMATCAELLSTNSTYSGYDVYIQGGLSGIFDADPEAAIVGDHKLYDGIKYRVEYVPLTIARSTVYKHDSFNSDSFLTDYVNEQDKLNDTENLGKFILTTLNRQGNLQYSVSGKTQNYGKIPKIGFRTFDDLVVSSRDLNLNNKIITYTLQLSKDFINQSDWVGRNSQYRAFEIPSNDLVFRQDKYTTFIVLTKDKANVLPKGYNVLSEYGNKMFIQNFCNLIGSTLAPASYAKVSVVPNKLDTPVVFDMPVNAYTIGTTVNLQMEFETNYSAGSKVLDKTINGVDTKIIENVRYTNVFGQIYSISSLLYPRGYVDNSADDADLFPQYSSAPPTGTEILTLNMVVDKDAREKYGINIEFPFITDDSSTLRAFTGIAKYNGLVRRKDDVHVEFALLDSDYFPSVNETILNTKRVRKIEGLEGTYQYDSTDQIYGIKYVSVPIPADLRFNGYVVYEAETKEIIYAVKEDIAPYDYDWSYTTDTVWFVPKKNLKDNTKPVE